MGGPCHAFRSCLRNAVADSGCTFDELEVLLETHRRGGENSNVGAQNSISPFSSLRKMEGFCSRYGNSSTEAIGSRLRRQPPLKCVLAAANAPCGASHR